MFDYRLGLMTGVDLPIPQLQATVHQPTIKEISMVGEQEFFIGIQLLCIDKKLYIQDEWLQNNITNFQLFMRVLNEKQMAEKKQAVEQVLILLFPKANILFTPRSMILNQEQGNVTIDEENFESFQKLLSDWFCLSGSGQEQFNPQGNKAKEIAQKLIRARQRVAEQKMQGKGTRSSAIGQYLSILTIALGVDLKSLCDLTIYQLHDLVERYSLYLNWDLDIRSRLAGAKPEQQIESWMKEIH